MPFIADRIYNWTPVTIDSSWGLRTIKPGHAYSLCNSLQCQHCGFLFLDIRFTSEELRLLYRDYRGEEYTKLREFYEPGYARINENLKSGINYLHRIESFLLPYVGTPTSILDWGGDTGINTPFFNTATVVHIFDISKKPVITGAQRVSRKEATRNSYNLITCCSVLEHVPYPEMILNSIRAIMDKGATLYIEVPYEEIMLKRRTEAYLEKRHWHEHINFFSERSLELVTARCGLRIIDKNIISVSNAGAVATVLQIALVLQ